MASRCPPPYAAKGQLSSLVVESCESRWKKSLELRHTSDLWKVLLNNEMISSAAVASEYEVDIILGDQDIALTQEAMKNALQKSLKDIINPGQWKREAFNDILIAGKRSFPQSDGNQYLGIHDFFDPNLILGFPFSLIRYPLAFLAKAPAYGISFFGCLFLLAAAVDKVTLSTPTDLAGVESQEQLVLDALGSIVASTFEIFLFSRLFLVVLLANRNEIIADAILDAVKNARQCKTSNRPVLISVLGMAHLNRVKKIIVDKSENW